MIDTPFFCLEVYSNPRNSPLIVLSHSPKLKNLVLFQYTKHVQGTLLIGVIGYRLPAGFPYFLMVFIQQIFRRDIRGLRIIPRFSINFRVRPEGVPAGLGNIGVYRGGKYNFAERKEV
jgi:hypothetical protein